MTDTLEIFNDEYTGVAGFKAKDDNGNIKTYIRPQGTKSISANGSDIDVTEYASVDVSVTPSLETKSVTITPTEVNQSQTILPTSPTYDGLSSVSVGAISNTYVGSGITRRSSSDLTASGDTVSAPDGTAYSPVTVNVSGGGTLTVGTKTATMSAVGQTLSFTGLLGTPKYWFVKTTSQISSSGSTTIYYITDGFWDGNSVKGNSFRIGSTRRIYSWTSGVSQSYSGGTLTITGGSATGSSPGQFFNGTYELTYLY